ncbi:MAG: hypothetical protein NXI04_12050 [Planctomycetaceae bacterium]|nr:hypothetical protein [Planctomycetaceae bacterium]
MSTRSIKRAVASLAIALCVSSSSAMACPNCKLGNETESSRPRAYMYSILFMIGMPATIFTGFGISFYRMVQQANAAQNADGSPLDSPDTPAQ